ncbi:MAG: DUF3991 and TOPRIM domain-containing protein [Planctomycetota bacterium]
MIDDREDELEAFKSRIDLRAYAESHGYEVDRKASSRNSAGMKHPDGDKIIIGVAAHDGHWVYFSVHDPADHGSIIDFVQRRTGDNIGQVRRELRPWLDEGSMAAPPLAGPTRTGASTHPLLPSQRSDFGPKLAPVARDMIGVRARFAAAESLGERQGHHPYLCGERAVPAALLASDRFADHVRIDERGNALFPHWNEEGVCGFEIKNAGFTGFAPGGVKGLWASHRRDEDRRLVIAETAIDALSYAALQDDGYTRYVSTSGAMNPQQPALLNRAIRNLPEGSRVVLAVDHDEGGEKLAAAISPVFKHVRETLGRNDLILGIDHPPTAGADWNDVLRGDPAGRDAARPTAEPGG